jgi:hypothetical protein
MPLDKPQNRAILYIGRRNKEVPMPAVAEFDARVENNTILIPPQYRESYPYDVRVIIVSKKPMVPKKRLYSMGVDMTGFTFNRDEANER